MLNLLRLIVIAIALLILIFGGTWALAETIATMPNKGGGKIVLTDEVCKSEGKTYKTLNRAYNYTSEGYGSEGCFTVEDETVVVIWNVQGSPQKMRYPAENFTLTKKSKGYGV
jgi:hypothetical protein